MDTAPPSSRVHHPHSRPLYSPQFRKDLSKKETDQQTCLCPCRELGFMNLGISRCFEILSWHIRTLRPPKEQNVWEKMRAQEVGVFILASMAVKVLGMAVQISVCQKIFPVVPVKFVYRGTSRP